MRHTAAPGPNPGRAAIGPRLWWLGLAVIWGVSSAADRLWLSRDQALPGWDQADYFNSAVDHGRALGLLAGGGWQGWDALLDLSPKIPPLSSLISGSVMALAGDSLDQASWSLTLWHGLLLLVVGLWGRRLLHPGFGLLAAALTALSPALAGLRVDFTLDLPVSASCALCLWLLWNWQRPDPQGGRWLPALAAALSLAMALLVKQSALLVLLPPALWAFGEALRRPRRRWQALAGLVVVVLLLMPWLHHNWITTLGGTERATIVSGAAEGDPGSLDPRSLLWYPRLWASQLGPLPIGLGSAGLLLMVWGERRRLKTALRHPVREWPLGWAWLLGTTISGWLFISLSPNKDARYIAPLLPLLCLLLARGWWQLGLALERRGPRWASGGLAAGVLAAGAMTARERVEAIQVQPGSALPQLINDLRRRVGDSPTTLLVVPSRQALNQHNTTALGRRSGGGIVGRQPSKRLEDNPLSLGQGSWFLLSGNRGEGMGKAARRLAAGVRRDRRFERVGVWPQQGHPPLELWRRRPDAPPPPTFDQAFIRLARGMETGPSGLTQVFRGIGPEHQLDGHLLYQRRVADWARQRLERHPADRDALWSLTLLAILQNRPQQASHWLERLQSLEPGNPWPASYRSAVLLIDWRAPEASQVANRALAGRPDPVLKGLADLSAVLSGNLLHLPALRQSLPAAVQHLNL